MEGVSSEILVTYNQLTGVVSQETLICRTQCANTMCLIFYVTNCAVCFRACVHMTVCHLQVPLCNVYLCTCSGNVDTM
jgi:hypothetical protein